MVDQCRHAQREEVIELCKRSGWSYESETAKAIRFSQNSFALNFNGEDNGCIDLIFDPIIAGANFVVMAECGAPAHERFSSNYQNFPRKLSRNERLNHFGVGLKFESIAAAENLLKRLQIPELV